MEQLPAALRDHGSLLDAPTHKAALETKVAQSESRFQDAITLWGEVPTTAPLARGKRIGVLYLAVGDPERARRALRDVERFEEAKLPQDALANDLPDLAIVQSLFGEHDAALATIERALILTPEAIGALNGPSVSFVRAIILVRAGRRDEGYAEATRLLEVPFGAPFSNFFGTDDSWYLSPQAKDPHFAMLINDPPSL